MDKTTIITAVLVLLIVAVAGWYLLARGKIAAPAQFVTTVAPTQAASTTVAPPMGEPIMNNTSNTMAPSNTMTGNTMSSNTMSANVMAIASYQIELETNATYGTYLANATGFTIYTFKADVPYSNVSACTGSCATNWPPFYTANLTLAPGLNATSFNTITRVGGAKQLTYNGWPLYLFVGDGQPGQVNGNEVQDFVVATR